MGTASSKSPAPVADVEDVNLDPRSPTPDVARTPLKGPNDSSKLTITRNADLSKTLENGQKEKLIHNNPILSAVIRSHLQSYDPRSPSQDFERTPISLSSKPQDPNERLNVHDGSVHFDGEGDQSQGIALALDVIPKNLSDGFLDATLDSTSKEPEPLGSSTASQDSIERETSIPAPTRLLETNFDYFELAEDPEKCEPDTPCKNETVVNNVEWLIKNRFNIADIDPRSPSQGIERTPIVLPCLNTNESLEEKVEEMSEESLVAALQTGIADFRRTPAITDTNLGLLIYEDDLPNAAALTPRKTKSASKGVRTPLSCMKNKNEERSQSAAMIVDAKKKTISRIPKRISNPLRMQSLQKTIPVDVQTAAQVEYENTPPNSHRDAWDKDSSVVL